MTVSEFNRIAGIVLNGLKSIVTNFSGVAGQISGPVAIVAKGSEIARTDSAGGGWFVRLRSSRVEGESCFGGVIAVGMDTSKHA